MKKLLSTTAFIGALALTAGSAEAANLQVNVGGFFDIQAGYTSDDFVDDSGGGATLDDANKVNFNTDAEIHFTVEGVADNGLEYGAVIELEADVDNADFAQNGGGNADKAYLFTQGSWGRLEAGDNTDAAEALSVNSATFASATGGIDGDYYRYAGGFHAVGAASSTSFIVRPDLPLANAGAGSTNRDYNFSNTIVGDVDEDATKLTYYTPRIAGFQGGISYIPNSAATGFRAPEENGWQNVLAPGINFTTQWDSVGIKLAAAGEWGDDESGTVGEDLGSWEVGGNLSFAGFTLGGSYADLGQAITSGSDSVASAGAGGVGTVVVVDDSKYWDIGGGYAWGPFSASVTYFDSSVDPVGAAEDNDFKNIVVGADYKAAPGLVPYAEVSFFNADGAAFNNDGTVVILGTQLTF